MKINFNKILKNFDNNDIVDDGKPVTLARISMNALMALFNDENMLTGEDKVKRYQLALKINKDPCADLNVEELALIKKLIGKMYGTLIVGSAFALIEDEMP